MGRRHRIVLGKHSGTGAVQRVLDGLGCPVDADTARHVLERVRDFVAATKRTPSDTELLTMAEEQRYGHV